MIQKFLLILIENSDSDEVNFNKENSNEEHSDKEN